MGEFCQIEIKNHDVKSDAMSKMLASLNKHNVTVGIHRAEGQEVINVSKDQNPFPDKRKIYPFKMIHCACIQEFGNEQKVLRDRRFKSPYTGKWFFIKKGTRLIIPPRPFIRIFSQSSVLKKKLTNAFKFSIKQNEKPEDVYKYVGDYARLEMKSRIVSNSIKPKNENMTIAYKGYDHPLFLSGKMMSAITSEVH